MPNVSLTLLIQSSNHLPKFFYIGQYCTIEMLLLSNKKLESVNPLPGSPFAPPPPLSGFPRSDWTWQNGQHSQNKDNFDDVR
jgi:hypothetical protein